jgi:hypothetical protein
MADHPDPLVGDTKRKVKIFGISMDKMNFKYHHMGIPTDKPVEGEQYLPDYKVYHRGFESSEFGIEWMRYEEGAKVPEIVKRLPHIAFEVDDILEAIKGRKVIIEPNSPSAGVIVAFVEEDGAPVEFIQFTKNLAEIQHG